MSRELHAWKRVMDLASRLKPGSWLEHLHHVWLAWALVLGGQLRLRRITSIAGYRLSQAPGNDVLRA